MLAIAINVLYTTLRRRGTTRQLAGAIVTCVIAALLLLPALAWYNLRFTVESGSLPLAEVEVALVYVVLFGWVLPLGVTTTYCLFTLPRTSTTSVHIPRPKRTTRINANTVLNPPRHQPGSSAPYVYREDKPWGWLEYRNGNFHGQRLALKRSIVTIGRSEDNEIWLDDDMASRNHAELAWDKELVYITDCDSLNGVLLNGKRIRGTALVETGNLLEIGGHRFLYAQADPSSTNEQEDPLAHHIWHSAAALQTDSEKLEKLPLPMAPSLANGLNSLALDPPKTETDTPKKEQIHSLPVTLPGEIASTFEEQDTAEINQVAALPRPIEAPLLFIIRDGKSAGQSFMVNQPIATIGRGSECNVVINDTSISRKHAQILRQANGNYVQDLGSRNGTKVNDALLDAPRLLEPGDIVCLGSIHLAYVPMPSGPNTPVPQSVVPNALVRPTNSGPMPLRLPSRPK